MEQKTIEALKLANKAIIEATDAIEKLWKAAEDPTVKSILEDKGYCYPFDKSLDEIYGGMIDWNYLAGEELEIAIAVTEISDKIDMIGLSETGTAQIIKGLMKRYKEQVDAFDADMEEGA